MKCPRPINEFLRTIEFRNTTKANPGSWALFDVGPSGELVLSLETTEPQTGLLAVLITEDLPSTTRACSAIQSLPPLADYVGPVIVFGTLYDSPCKSVITV